MLQTFPQKSHSSLVKLFLECGDVTVRLAQVSPDSIVAKNAVDLLPCEGIVVTIIDGREHRSRVRLPNGMSRSSPETPIESLPV